MSKEVYLVPTSFAQQRLWFLDRLEPGTPVFNIPAALRLSGHLDIDVLRRSLEEVARRHETLRTRFAVVDEEPVQVIEPPTAVELPLVDLSHLGADARRERARELADESARLGFDLGRGPLWRASVLRLGAEEHVLLFTMHHIISDAWSMGVLIREVGLLYEAFARGDASPLPELAVQYGDYALWQRGRLEGGELERQLAYWEERLAGLPEALELPADRPRRSAAGRRGGSVPFRLTPEATSLLKAVARREGATLFMALLAGFEALLYRHTGQGRFAVGTPVAGRAREEVRGLIGFFVNTLALRAEVGGGEAFAELLGRVRAEALGAYAHQEVPFERVVERVRPARSLDRSPIFQVMLALDNTPREELRLGGLRVERLASDAGSAKYDLSLLLEERDGGVGGVWLYDADLFDEATVRSLTERYARLLEGAAADPALRVSELPLLTEEERHRQLVEWNDTAAPFPADSCVHELFERQARLTPDALAVVGEDGQFTYAELDARAGALARRLRSLGVGPESRVALLLERGAEMLAALLGVLKAGGAYVPLDPEYPQESLSYMLEDSGAEVVLTRGATREVRHVAPRVVDLAEAWCTAEGGVSDVEGPAVKVSPENLAYVIYTSGSTGRPKGVMVSHRSLVNYTLGVTERLGLSGGLSFALVSTPAADLGHTALYPSLCTGGTLHVVSRERAADARTLAEYFERHAVDCLKIVPSHLSALLAGEGAEKIMPRRRLVLGGEASDRGLARKVRELSPDCAVFNHYGPTETTVGVLTYGVGDDVTRDDAERLPLGRPLPNARVYVLDRFFNPVPVGAVGELYVGGAGLARGYLNRPGATAERFVPDPFSGEPGARLYRTGDVARYLPGGEIEFLGRADSQVKVRGFRVELGEVEAALRGHPLVRDAALLAWEERPGEVSLAAYVVAEPGARAVGRGELRQFLADKLPRHMLPAVYTLLEEMPLTANGKVDRRALPPPERESRPGDEASDLARTAMEELLAGVWEELLGVGRVGVTDDFFELGGHSLLATRLVSRVRERLGVEVGLREVFERPTVRGLASAVDEALGRVRVAAGRIERRAGADAAPLSYAQRRLWFLDRLQPGSPFYNLPGAVRLRGALDVKAFEQSLNEVVRRHEILRTTYKTVEGEPAQVVSPALYLPLPVTDLSSLPHGEREAEARRLSEEEAARPFDLAAGPVLRAQLLRLGEREHVLLLTVHHIAADGWAMGLLVREVAALYEAYTRGLASPLPELPIQYADFAQWQRRRLAEGVLERDLAYWERRLEGAPALLNLPTDRPRPPVQSHRGSTFEFALAPELTRALRELSRREGATLFMTLLAGFVALLQRHAGQDDISVGTPVAGRQQEETESLIGLFINMLVLRADLSGDPTFRQLLGQMRERALEAYAHQEAPFEQVVERLRPARALDRSPLFQVMLALDNTPQEELRLGDLAAERVPLRGATAKYDLTFSLEEGGGGLRGVVEYRTDLFDEETVRALAERYRVLLEGAAADPALRVSELPLLTEEERHRQLVEWNDTAAPFPADSCVHELFERQARLTPDSVALVFEGERLSYAELDERADALARRLRRSGVGAESRVGVLLERSVELVVALLGVLKAGGAYVPLDPEYPAERLAFMAQDSGLSLVVTQERLAGLCAGWGVSALVVGADGSETAVDVRDGGGHGAAALPDNLAYVIYTSGSTGRPKGVCVSHRNVVNLLTAMDETLGGGEPGVWLAVTSVSFDISVLELFWTLARGFKVVLQGRLDLTAGAGGPADAASERALDFSLFYFASDDNTGGEDIYELLLEGAKFADEHGFSAVWTPERHFHAFGGTYPNPSVTSAALAAVTRRVEIRAGSVVIPLHDPLRVAEEWAVVDNLSKGRVAISFASGWHANDFVLAPDIYESRHEVMYRNIELVRRLWRGEPVMRRTGAGNEVEVRVHPRPVQPELRFWITAAGNPETFRTAGRLGANLLTHLLGQTVAELGEKITAYREAWREHGHGPGEGHVTLMLHTFVGEDLEEVRETVRVPFSNYLRSSISLLRHSARSLGRDLDSGRVTEADMEAVLAHAFDRYFGTAALLGTPESCLPMIERLRAVGVDEVGCLIDFGVSQKRVLASLPHLTELKERSGRPRHQRGYSLAAQLREHGVTHLQLTPSMARLLLADEETAAALRGLRKLLVGGEALTAALARQLRERLDCEVHNMYGPTETTVWSTTHEVGEADIVPIGRPIGNTTVRILDRALRLAPTGVPGEIYLGGAGVARGYLNRPGATAERFVPDPFSGEPGARLYRTGDLARYLPGGEIEFLGRADSQVKVRGFRVELGEVEAALRGCPGVREAVVVAREDASGDKRLLAYVVAADGAAAAQPDGERLTPAALRRLLHEKLPSHLVPSALSFLDELPLTPNGKVDRRALPDPTGPASGVGLAPPRSEAEQTIAAIWREVLKLESVGADDNFFELGGTSLLVVQVNGRLREAFGRDVPIVEMFRHPTVGTLARFIEGGGDERPSFGQAQSRAARQAEAMGQQKRLTQARPARRTPVRPR